MFPEAVSRLVNFESFLNDNSIKKQKKYIKEHHQAKDSIVQYAKSYLNSASTKATESELKLKAWLLLPKEEAKKIHLEKGSFNSDFEQKVLKNVLKTEEYWRAKELEKYGVNFETELKNGESLLHIACEKGDLKIVKVLLNLDIHIDLKNNKKLTPLQVAVSNNNMDIATHLIVNGADALKKNKKGETIFHYLNEQNQENESLKLFKEYCNYTKMSGISAVVLASRIGLTNHGQVLIDEVGDLNQKADKTNDYIFEGDTLLHGLLNEDPNISLLKYLIEKGADPEQIDANKEKPLFVAVSKQYDEEIIKYLLEKNGRFDSDSAKMKEGYLLLQEAISNGASIKSIEMLVDHGIPLNREDLEILEVFKFAIFKTPLDLELVQFLLDRGLKLDQKDLKGRTPLHLVLEQAKPNKELTQLLINSGANLNAINNEGETCSSLIRAYKLDIPLKSINKEKDREFKLRLLLANSWSITGMTEASGVTFSLEGGRGLVGQRKATKLLKKFKEHHVESSIDFEKVYSMIESGYKANLKNPDEIAKEFKEGKPLIFSTGWLEHTVQVAFVGSYMLVSNRGEKSKDEAIQVFKIDRDKKLSKKNIDILLDTNLDKAHGSYALYEMIPRSLGYEKKDLICELVEDVCRLTKQKSGNCWWLSAKSGVLGVFTIQNLIEASSKTYTDQRERKAEYKRIIDFSQAVYKYYSEFSNIQILHDYITRPPDSAGRDHELVKNVVERLNSKEWKYIFNHRKDIKFSSIALMKTLEERAKVMAALPPLYAKEEVENWIKDYKTRFNLNDDFKPIDVENKTISSDISSCLQVAV